MVRGGRRGDSRPGTTSSYSQVVLNKKKVLNELESRCGKKGGDEGRKCASIVELEGETTKFARRSDPVVADL